MRALLDARVPVPPRLVFIFMSSVLASPSPLFGLALLAFHRAHPNSSCRLDAVYVGAHVSVHQGRFGTMELSIDRQVSNV